ncbi:hypothetical protein LJPFL01_3599 [Lelliottia jeotgali]|nr:hypothetical protein LJPFL01_3599 [Lelliottia jeotgali]
MARIFIARFHNETARINFSKKCDPNPYLFQKTTKNITTELIFTIFGTIDFMSN